MNSNEEIILSSLCDRIMAFCNRLNKRLDVIDERERPEYQHYSHHQPLTEAYGQPPYASFDSGVNNTGWPPPPNPEPTYVTLWQTTAETYLNNQPQPYFHQQPPPPNTYPPPPNTHQPLQPPQTYEQQPHTCRATQTQPRQQFPQPNSCWYPPTQQLHTPLQYPSYTGGPTAYSGYEPYTQCIPQPPDPAPPYGVPTYGLPGAQPQKQDPIQPAGKPPYTGQPATGWYPLTTHHRSAAPLPAAAVPPYRGCPMEAVIVPDDDAVVVEEVQDKSCSEVMLFNRKSYDGDEMLMVVPPPLAAISLPCSPDVSGEEGELFEDEPPLPAGIPPPCSPNQVCVEDDKVLPHHLEFFQDYSDHTSVPIELVDSMEYEHLGEGNDRIEVNGENKDRDRVDEKESLVLGEEEKRANAFLDVDIIEEPTYTMLEVMEMAEDENSLVFHTDDSHFETTFPLAWWPSMETNGEYNWTEQSCTFDPGGEMRDQFSLQYVYIEYAIVGYWGTKQRSFAFDPGGNTLSKLLFATLLIVSWFPP